MVHPLDQIIRVEIIGSVKTEVYQIQPPVCSCGRVMELQSSELSETGDPLLTRLYFSCPRSGAVGEYLLAHFVENPTWPFLPMHQIPN